MATDAQIRQLADDWRKKSAYWSGQKRGKAATLRLCADALSALLSSPVEAEPLRDNWGTYPPRMAAPVEAERPPEPGWLPIETAPKDGTSFLASSAASSVFLAHWANGLVDSSSVDATTGAYEGRHATHWQPLPAPYALAPPTPGEGHEGQSPAPVAREPKT